MKTERTLTILKPGVLQRRLVGDIISRFDKAGFKIVAMKLIKISEEMAETHYVEHREKSFFPILKKFITSGPVIVMVLYRDNAVKGLRNLCGATNPKDAHPGTVRGDYGVTLNLNIIHASDSAESAEREIDIFFDKNEIQEYDDGLEKWF